MTACEERLDPVSCRLDELINLLERQGQLAMIGLVIAILSVVVATVLAVAALRASSAANRLATQNVDLIRRSERRRLVDALEAYRASRAKDMGLGRNGNIRHYLPLARGIISEINEPNAQELADWLTSAIDLIITDPDAAERQTDRHRLRMEFPPVAASWLSNPDAFHAEPFLRGPEQRDRIRAAQQP